MSSTVLIGRLLLVTCRAPIWNQPSISTPFSAVFISRYLPNSLSTWQIACAAVAAPNGSTAAPRSGESLS